MIIKVPDAESEISKRFKSREAWHHVLANVRLGKQKKMLILQS